MDKKLQDAITSTIEASRNAFAVLRHGIGVNVTFPHIKEAEDAIITALAKLHDVLRGVDAMPLQSQKLLDIYTAATDLRKTVTNLFVEYRSMSGLNMQRDAWGKTAEHMIATDWLRLQDAIQVVKVERPAPTEQPVPVETAQTQLNRVLGHLDGLTGVDYLAAEQLIRELRNDVTIDADRAKRQAVKVPPPDMRD